MRLPYQLIDSQFFSFESEDEFWLGVADAVDYSEKTRIRALLDAGLLPLTSQEVLAALLGVNPGIIWSLIKRPQKYYRQFTIPKGKSVRTIVAPRIGLKIIQKWLSVQIHKQFSVADHVFGFVPNRSHIGAAAVHCQSKWVLSLDIEEFFPSTPQATVQHALATLGYDSESAELIAKLCCFNGVLAQGAPSSPVLSNLVLLSVDEQLQKLATGMGVRLSRYADDITFSGEENVPADLKEGAQKILDGTPWSFAKAKTHFAQHPQRLKVHGLLVHGSKPRLTKGYRNRIRTYRHLLRRDKVSKGDLAKIRGHVGYSKQIESFEP